MNSLKDFYLDFMQQLLVNQSSQGGFLETVFTEAICEMLSESGTIDDYIIADYKKENPSMKINAYYFDPDTEVLSMVMTDFTTSMDIVNVTPSEISRRIKKVVKFYITATRDNLHTVVDESLPIHELVHDLYYKKIEPKRLRIVYATNQNIRKVDAVFETTYVSGIECEIMVRDIGFYFRTMASDSEKEVIEIDFSKFEGNGIPCLPAHLDQSAIQSYLFVLSGNILADIFEKYGDRLLEQNVRTFLQFRGKVNRGMRGTLQNEPQMFFAYNNGLTATAESIETTHNETRILNIRDFQIVNGGQTSASILLSRLKNNVDLSEVYVQVKLSVVSGEERDSVVPKISEYANTQNKVSASDFFSNHPFHLRIEDFSRRLWANNTDGSLRMTHWFYERARGQYLNSQSKLTPSQTRAYQKESPRNQVITKTDLAKYLNIWDQKPHTVCLGAQKNFSIFANEVSKRWKLDSDNAWVNEKYFTDLVAIALLFKSLDREVMKQDWYGGYKAQINAYTLSKLSSALSDIGDTLDLSSLWDQQQVPSEILNFMIELAELVNNEIRDTPELNMNISEWCKKYDCWKKIKVLPLEIPYSIKAYTVSSTQNKIDEKEFKRIQRIDQGISNQEFVLGKGSDYWNSVLVWNNEYNELTEKEIGILQRSATYIHRGVLPTENQCKVLVNMINRISKNGFNG